MEHSGKPPITCQPSAGEGPSTPSPLDFNTDPEKGGVKFDNEKLRWDLMPWDALAEVAAVLNLGAEKYEPWNWSKGMPYGRLFSSAQRHLIAFWAGQDDDAETGESHIAHAAANLLFLLAFITQQSGTDDRPGVLAQPRTKRKR
jgi:hypothetical protein